MGKFFYSFIPFLAIVIDKRFVFYSKDLCFIQVFKVYFMKPECLPVQVKMIAFHISLFTAK